MHYDLISLRILCVFGISSFLGSCTPEERTRTERADAEPHQTCANREIPVRVVPEDSLLPAERCRLVDLAVASMGNALGTSGVLPSDTSAVESALLVSLSETTPEGTLIRATWHVTLSLEGRPYDAEVIIDRSSGQVTVSRIHKPLSR